MHFHSRTHDRYHTCDDETFTKRELHPQERNKDKDGHSFTAPWTVERLRNEYLALEYITTHTTIPVPKVISLEKHQGVWQLTMSFVHGKTLDNIVNDRERALVNANKFITTKVLPQLRSLKSCDFGSLTGVVFPPAGVTERDKRDNWPRRSARTQEFSFCHNDLAQHNIIMNPETSEVAAIIDWELSGFYIEAFETPYWVKRYDEPGYGQIGAERIDELIAFLLAPNDQKTDNAEEIPQIDENSEQEPDETCDYRNRSMM